MYKQWYTGNRSIQHMLLLLHNDGAHALTCDRTEVTVLSIVDFVFL